MAQTSEISDVIALSRLKGVDASLLLTLREKCVGAADFLSMSSEKKGETLGLNQVTPWHDAEIREAKAIGKSEAEFCDRHGIRVISPILEGYPGRLEILDDAPKCLFVLGNADLDAFHIIGIVGTRKVSPVGLNFCNGFVKELGELVNQPIIVSGLAYGTDSCAHQAALNCGLPTVAVLAHGLSMIYPAQNRQLATRILSAGGALVSEYLSHEKPFRGHFLERNKVIAALSDGVMVVESAIKGGAMNTAHAAFEYSRTVMAMPGRPTDPMSEGCNHLIRNNVAVLTVDARQACNSLCWEIRETQESGKDKTLFREPEAGLLSVYQALQQSESPMGIDSLAIRCNLPASRISAMLYALEEDGFIIRHPNNRYSLI